MFEQGFESEQLQWEMSERHQQKQPERHVMLLKWPPIKPELQTSSNVLHAVLMIF
jgi:hypothetical protein